jgi:hypothetical protein
MYRKPPAPSSRVVDLRFVTRYSMAETAAIFPGVRLSRTSSFLDDNDLRHCHCLVTTATSCNLLQCSIYTGTRVVVLAVWRVWSAFPAHHWGVELSFLLTTHKSLPTFCSSFLRCTFEILLHRRLLRPAAPVSAHWRLPGRACRRDRIATRPRTHGSHRRLGFCERIDSYER